MFIRLTSSTTKKPTYLTDKSMNSGIANERLSFGYWEADSAASKESQVVIHALLERVSRLVKLTHLHRNTSVKVES
jgi:IS30 family transposase